ncbi:NAD(P)-dependent oxidoreductase [Arthrobacter sp. FX8]|uniref:NAD(P)-dependent oxidoreductase n=1 Tax=Arthrobacter sp. FX8 TaxID=2997335 RepID=UPI00227D6D8D|nr:NAD(P)-dependent oxidoreductase [Arthrobacter sp. FX8]WAJ33005.1 NAD(P)-dependent oxidoreductase [Arthrobacter sp. FX8]
MSEKRYITSVAFIGLGNMGGPMASRLAGRGFKVHGFDLSPEARQRLSDAGGEAHETPSAAVASADAVILMLPSSAVVEKVILDDEVLAALQPGAVIIDMSSSEPGRTVKLAATLHDRGHILLDAPVSGGVRGAESGNLTIMAGGDQAHLQEVLPVLEKLGYTTRIGPVGAGHALKALNNLMSATHLLISSEAILAGEKFGIEPAVMLDAVNGSSGRSGSTENKWPNFILPGTFNSGFNLSLMVKDMGIAVSLAESLGVSNQLGECATALWRQAQNELPEGADHTEIVKWLRQKTR